MLSQRSHAQIDLSALKTARAVEFLQRAHEALSRRTGSYLTLSRIGPDRREQQVARRIRGHVARTRYWLEREICSLSASGLVRFRVRLWGAGGVARGGITVAVTYPEQDLPREQTSSVSDSLEELRQRLEQIESVASAPPGPGWEQLMARLEAVERKQTMLLEAFLRVGDAAG